MLPSFASHIIASITLAIPAMILAETSLSLPRPRPAAADDLVGRAAARGAEHPLHRDGALALRARRRRGHRGDRAQLPRRRLARRRRSVQQMTVTELPVRADRPSRRPPRPVLEVRDLVDALPDRATASSRRSTACPSRCERGKTLCVVGESGSGKSVTARSILQIVDAPGRIVARIDHCCTARTGRRSTSPGCDPRGRAIRAVRGREIAMIFQEPMSSLSPVHTVGDQIMEVLRLHLRHGQGRPHGQRCIELLRQVEIPKPELAVDRYTFRVLRRHAPARDDRHGARLQSVAAHRRRADDRARRDDPGRDPRPHPPPAASSTAWR